MEIDNLIGIKKYFLQLSGDYVVNVDMEGVTTGEVSTMLKELFFRFVYYTDIKDIVN